MTLAALPMPSFTGADLSVRVNSALTELRAARTFPTVASLLADATLSYSAGLRLVAADDRIVTAGGAAYQVAAATATACDVITAGGVKLNVLPVNGVLHDEPFGIVGDGTTDDTAAILRMRDAAEAGRLAMRFRPLTYRFTQPLVFNGVDIDFNGAELLYAGPMGQFALTLQSWSGAGTTQVRGNRYANVTLCQRDFTPYRAFTGTATFDPPSLPADATITGIAPGGVSTTVPVPGARAGGYARATFTGVQDGIAVTAWVSADDVVTVHFSNYGGTAVDLPAGTIAVTVVNNAYHGLCLGGSLGKLEGVKVRGFTGVSFALGSGRCQVSGVSFPASQKCYYWDVDLNVNPAAGWGAIIQPRNNQNLIGLSLFPGNFYNDAAPRRACCINQVVVSGVTNKFKGLSLECNASEEALVLTPAANQIRAMGTIYYEANGSYSVYAGPAVWAQPFSSGCEMAFRMNGPLNQIRDQGAMNDLRRVAAYYMNSQQARRPTRSRNLVENGDFENGARGWGNFTSGTQTLTIGGTTSGYLSGRSARLEVTDGRPNFQQDLHTVGKFRLANLVGQNVTFSAWVRTNLPDIALRVNGLPSLACPADGSWYLVSMPILISSATSLSLSLIKTTTAVATGFLEVANVTAFIGTEAGAVAERTTLEGAATFNPPAVAAGAWGAGTTVPVPGAESGDIVAGVSHSQGGGLLWFGTVSATDTVSVSAFNPTVAAIDLASGTLRVRVMKP